ncbi:MAG: dihydropteroate synthase [Candidatus Krumholzibacteriota bacterium]|nr:dihydropteroate synthase [Candidatus Krumholzibacteriota bacterium]
MKYTLRLLPSGDMTTLKKHLKASGVDAEGINIICQKTQKWIIQIENVSPPAANIIKQQMLSLGQEAAVHRDVITGKPELSTVYIISNKRKIFLLEHKLKSQPFNLKKLGKEISNLAHSYLNVPRKIELTDHIIDFTSGPVIAGVLNVTSDSFSDGGLYVDPDMACERALQMVEEGASIIDIGGESSRPGAKSPGLEEEIKRVEPVLKRLSGKLKVPISIDTRNSRVARLATDYGAEIINDISGLSHDPAMLEVALEKSTAVIIMHMLGTPETMQNSPYYKDPVTDIIRWLAKRTDAVIEHGIPKDKIIIDPGIGFGKRLEDNLDIIRELSSFKGLGFPVLLGYSRKSFVGLLTKQNIPDERAYGGLAVLAKSLQHGGADIIRAHDVKETNDFINVWNAVTGEVSKK